MGGFTDETRKKITKKLRQEQETRAKALTGADKVFYKEIKNGLNYSFYRADVDELAEIGKIYKALDEGKKPGEAMSGHHKALGALIPERFVDDLLYIADKYNRFPYSRSTYRPTVRRSDYYEQMHHVLFTLRSDNYALWSLDGTLDEMYAGKSDPELTDYFFSQTVNDSMVSGIIAARVDKGDTALEDAIYNVIMGEGGNVSYTVIHAVVMSDSKRLHEALVKLLLAAKLQEGLRQAICESCDSGTTEAFFAVFNAILDNDLARYSSIKRAVMTWTGIGTTEIKNVERLTDKQLGLIRECLISEEARQRFRSGSDAVEVYLSIWAEGFYDSDKAADTIIDIVRGGTKQQMLCASYYLNALWQNDLADRVSREVIKLHSGDHELLAAYLPFFLKYARSIYHMAHSDYGSEERRLTPELLGMTRGEVLEYYDLLKKTYGEMPKKEIKYEPFIFPWYKGSVSRGDVVKAICKLGYALGDDDISDECCAMIVSASSSSRYMLLKIFTERPTRPAQYDAILACIPDREELARKTAAEMAQDVKWRDGDYPVLEGMLKYKGGDVRTTVISQLMKQDDAALCETVKRLLSSKTEEMRAGGLDIMLNLSKDTQRSGCLDTLRDSLSLIKEPTQKELILIKQLDGDAGSADAPAGGGLYDSGKEPELPGWADNPEGPSFGEFFAGCEDECIQIIAELDELFKKNGNLEYKSITGETKLLSNLSLVKSMSEASGLDCWPYPEIWREYWNGSGHSLKALLLLWYAAQNTIYSYGATLTEDLNDIFFDGTGILRLQSKKYIYNVNMIIRALTDEFVPNVMFLESVEAFIRGMLRRKPEELFFEYKRTYGNGMYLGYFMSIGVIKEILVNRCPLENDEQARELLTLKLALRRHIQPVLSGAADPRKNKKVDLPEGMEKWQVIDIPQYIQAYSLGIITKRDVFMALFERVMTAPSVGLLSRFAAQKLQTWRKNALRQSLGLYDYSTALMEEDSAFMKCCREVYADLLSEMLPTELKRGDTPTKYSSCIGQITQIYGAEYFVETLTALGKDTLDRSDNYWSNDTSRRHVFSHLLGASIPLPEDNAEKLGALVKKAKITEKRLVEAAMYAPDWIELIGEVLGWEGFPEGCYYFIAHMKTESNDDKRNALVARYTPLSPEELCDGAFDIEWFERSYSTLGEKRFDTLYTAAKYICSGSRHSRARKYADARLGKYDLPSMEKEIIDKRNKDTLMAYALVPIKDKDDTLHRYSFIKDFQKQAKQYGAQRRQSETKAAEMALGNLARSAGYADPMRLTLAMETALTEGLASLFEWRDTGDVRLRVAIDENGKSSVECQKGGKALKSVPAALRKDPYVLELRDAVSALNDQYSRTRSMLEQAMENSDEFTAEELNSLLKNPVAAPTLSKLVYIRDGELGLIGEGIPAGGGTVRIAHPFDMYKSGKWHELQQLIFEKQIKQPFKQVFRELYIKTADEVDQYHSLRFAGNQIMPKRTVGALRSRRWIADYEEGLQKIFYKENLAARIYALADWFSPADIEAPTLEWVEFSERLSGKAVKIADVPDIVFSEVMRDVDLAVSVAHAGGVDPETSHSTVELRRAVVEFNLPLFGLKNVELTDTHAIIKGTRAEYSVHLGSGVVHKLGGAQIAVLPVHSQQRGRLFLPFIDDDPKTAEIMSKIVLFAEDGKLKDPSILSQIN